MAKSKDEIIRELTETLAEHERAAQTLLSRDLELTRANERLRDLDRQKSEFVSVAAHQFRTPLSSIKWALKMLLDGDMGALTEEQRSVLLKGYESNERVIHLVNEMLDVDRIEGGRFKYSFVALPLGEVIEKAIASVRILAEEKSITVAYEAPEEPLPNAYADPEKISALLQNLLENAIKYTMSGGRVVVSARDAGNMVEVDVSDTGIGIPQDQQRDIFQKFFRGRNAVKVVTEGSGLGLFIAREIVEKHGGKIWFDSVEGRGTTFHFTLPKARSYAA